MAFYFFLFSIFTEEFIVGATTSSGSSKKVWIQRMMTILLFARVWKDFTRYKRFWWRYDKFKFKRKLVGIMYLNLKMARDEVGKWERLAPGKSRTEFVVLICPLKSGVILTALACWNCCWSMIIGVACQQVCNLVCCM